MSVISNFTHSLIHRAHTCWEEALLTCAKVFAKPPSIIKLLIELQEENQVIALHLQLIFSATVVGIYCGWLGA